MIRDMPDSEFNKIAQQPDWLIQATPWFYATWLSLIGGTVDYLERIRKSNLPFKLTSYILDMTISMLTGFVAFVLCDMAEMSWSWTVAIIVISSKMGSRAWYVVERALITPIFKDYDHGYHEARVEQQEKQNNQKTVRAKRTAKKTTQAGQ